MNFSRHNEETSTEKFSIDLEDTEDSTTCFELSMSTINQADLEELEESLNEPGFHGSLDMDRHSGVKDGRETRFRGDDSADLTLGESYSTFAMDEGPPGQASRRNLGFSVIGLEAMEEGDEEFIDEEGDALRRAAEAESYRQQE